MAEKDFKEEQFRKELFEVRMKLAALASKDGNPLYEKMIEQVREEHVRIKREYIKYKTDLKLKSEGMKR